MTATSGVLWIAITPEPLEGNNGTAAGGLAHAPGSKQGGYPLPWPAHENATVGDVVGSQGAAGLLLRVSIPGHLPVRGQGGEGGGDGACLGVGEVTVWRTRASTAFLAPGESSLRLRLTSLETGPWQLDPPCGYAEILPATEGMLSLAVPFSLVMASQQQNATFQNSYEIRAGYETAGLRSHPMEQSHVNSSIVEGTEVRVTIGSPTQERSCASHIILQVAAALRHTCVLAEGGRVRCWGLGEKGQLGTGGLDSVLDPSDLTKDVVLDRQNSRALQVVAGDSHTCALLEGGRVRCWGRGNEG